ncbi:MAG TPA: tetratricopeptide repeat protein [Bacteroidota bacterium]|nr:tetratricopeptide repeat protein [Bacteroidota bacterium]
MKTTVKRELVAVCIAVLSLLCTASAWAAVPDSSKVDQLIAQGNVYSEKTFENQKALESFQAALALEPNNYEALWRVSRTYIDIGEHLPANTDQEKTVQLQTYEKALEFANKAVAANANGAMGYTRRAIANGRIALFKGVWESLDLVKQTKADCEKAITLDPREAAAFYVLGRTHMKVSEKPKIVRWPLGLGWANLDDAVKNYEKAIALRPDFIMYRLDCARAYVEQDEYAKARAHLNAIASLPTLDEDDTQFRKEAQELLEKVKGK